MAEGNDYWLAKVETMRRIEAKLRAEIETLDRSLRESWANEKRLADERDGLRSLMRGIQQLRSSDPNAAAIADAALAGVETTCRHEWVEAIAAPGFARCKRCGEKREAYVAGGAEVETTALATGGYVEPDSRLIGEQTSERPAPLYASLNQNLDKVDRYGKPLPKLCDCPGGAAEHIRGCPYCA